MIGGLKSGANQIEETYIKEMSKHPKRFKIKIKFIPMSEEEKKRALFDCFDILLATKKKEESTLQAIPQKKVIPPPIKMHFLRESNIIW